MYARRIDTLVNRDLLARLGLPPDLRLLPDICAAWMRSAPEILRDTVQPVRYANGELSLRASGAAWATRIRHSRTALIAALRREPVFRSLVGVQVRVVPSSTPVSSNSPARRAAPLSSATRKLLRDVAAGTADPALRAAIARLAESGSRS
jgi:hypothetical protein